MPRPSKKIAAGRNDPRVRASSGRGLRKSNARDIAMKSGDLRSSPMKTRSRFSRKRATQADISSGTEPFSKESYSGPRARNAKESVKKVATYADAKRGRIVNDRKARAK